MNPIYKEFQYGDQTVVMETNKVAKQATGSVTVTIGDTVVLTTVVGAKSPRPGQDFFPLTSRLSIRAVFDVMINSVFRRK